MNGRQFQLQALLEAAGVVPREAVPDVTVTGIADNSQAVQPGELFVATVGTKTDSHRFVADAAGRGAAAAVVSKMVEAPEGFPLVLVEDTAVALGRLAHAYYGDPTKDMLVIGVSGTNGKTTTTYLLESILSVAGRRPGVIGTIEHRFGGNKVKAHNTTPSPLELALLFAGMRDAGVDAVAMEVSSHAVDQKRIEGIKFDAGVFTNLTQDHLDYHKTMEAYAEAKRGFYFDYLLRGTGAGGQGRRVGAFNQEDDYGRLWAAQFPGRSVSFGAIGGATLRSVSVDYGLNGTSIVAEVDGQSFNISTPLLGRFNVMNVLGAVAVTYGIGLDPEAILTGVASMSRVPGRFESVQAGQDFHVLVDYAHTPDALENVLTNAKHLTAGRIITVFGCGGDRDPLKRPIMGRIAGNLSSYVILTNDNPRTEDPEKIAAMVHEGIGESKVAADCREVILDRRAAISRAIGLARTGDLVMIAGKGHEDYQILGNETIHFDDREVAQECIAERRATN